jgi:glycosyltransferase involved in cell wall biosynthesis
MKITFVLDGGDSLSGGHRAIAMYAQGLARLGHSVELVARPQRPPTVRDRARRLLKGTRGQPDREPKPSHFQNAGLTLKILPSWRPVVDDDLSAADVVFATWWETVDWVCNLSPAKGIKAHLVQDYEIWGGREDQVDRCYRLPILKIVTSPWLGDFIHSRFHQKPIGVISCGVDLQQFHAEERRKPRTPTVGLTYSCDHRKGCDISIQAWRTARQSLPDLRLVACGNTRPSPDLPLPGAVHYKAWANDDSLRELYSQCDCWLFGTRWEGFGLPMLEAMACGTPVVGTPAGAATELLSGGGGLLVNLEDPDDMARAIVQICRLPDAAWRGMSTAAQATAALYSWDKPALALEGALKRVVHQAQAETCP